ncbi:beta-microseminoprotein-like [Haliotis rufescens]|uniref:beta-microseminoprotein-like n=1 Tax=Haliotis rufescens TaxID=6454 RepID=UPI00201EB3D4|nr:beta-microseminoprotein-like [Haliotis rufescens]
MFKQGLLFLGLVVSTQGFGYLDMPTVVTNKYGTDQVYCEYQNMKMLPDSIWRTTECEECECTKSGMFCEGFGFNAGLLEAPEGCDIVNDACNIRLVDAQDDTKDCESFKQGPPPHLFEQPSGTAFDAY